MNIVLEGDIGWEITPNNLRNELAGKGDVEIDLTSFGGAVFDGIDCFNIINEHKGFVTINIGSIAASSAGWLLMAANKVRVHKNSSWMKHPVQNGAWGTSDELRIAADIADGLEGIIIDIFNDYGLDKSEQNLTEKWIFGGQNMIDYGIADELIEDDDETIIDSAFENKIKAKVSATSNKVEQHYAENKSDFFTKGKNFLNLVEKKPKFINNTKPPVHKQELNSMNLEQFKNEHPDVYAQAVKLGVTKEKNRVEAFLNFIDISPEEVRKSIEAGNEFGSKDHAAFSRLSLNKASVENLKDDSADDIDTDDHKDDKKPEDKKDGEMSDEAKNLALKLKNKYDKKAVK